MDNFKYPSVTLIWCAKHGEVVFIKDDREDLQWPNDGQCSSFVIIIMISHLHIHILEIVHLMCNRRLSSDRMHIPKTFQCLVFEIPSELVTMSFYNVVIEVCFLNRSQFRQGNWLQTNLTLTAFTSNKRFFHFILMERTFSTTFSPIGNVSVLCYITSTRGIMMVTRGVAAPRLFPLVSINPNFHGYETNNLLWYKLLVFF